MRKIIVQGTTKDADIVVTINGVICKDTLKDYIFSFESPSEFHGSVPISVQVVSGQISITQALACYPTNLGTITFPLPINPFVRLHKDHIEELSNIIIKEGELFEYNHLIVNGPNYWVTTSPGDIFVDDISVTDITPIFEYSPYTATHRNNAAIDELKRSLLP